MPEQKFIEIRGAREHNLKSIDIDIPRDRLVVITGLSGSGKSSLAFDTIYAEGQRRYVESLSAYARQFLDMMQKPDVDHITGLSPGDLHRAEDHLEEPALHRRHRHRDLRLPAAALRPGRHPLLARHRPADRGAAGQPDGRHHHGAARGHPRLPAGAHRPRPQGRVPQGIPGPAQAGLPAGQGQRRVPRPGDAARARQEVPPQHRRRRRPHRRARGPRDPPGRLPAHRARPRRRHRHPRDAPPADENGAARSRSASPSREKFACPVSGFTIPEIEPRLFSFNAPYGACPACDGLGVELFFDPRLVVPDESLPLLRGAIAPWAQGPVALVPPDHRGAGRATTASTRPSAGATCRSRRSRCCSTAPRARRSASATTRAAGSTRSSRPFEGVIPNLERRYRETD